MITINCTQPTYFDIDNTILMWSWPANGVEQWIELDPWNDGTKVKLAVNTEMVEQLKKHSARKHTVIVWSLGGWQWAETVVKALDLEKYVDLVIEKPCFLYDDQRPEDFMPKAQWVGRKEWLSDAK